jgi:ribonuclease-3 family protein
LLISKKIDDAELRQYSPIALAYIGDAVFELMVRTQAVTVGPRRIKDIHLETVQKVNAQSQAQVIRQISSQLSDEEKDIVRRGRNAHSTPPRHADHSDYRMSTGFEALLGYLYLKGDYERLQEMVAAALSQEEAPALKDLYKGG